MAMTTDEKMALSDKGLKSGEIRYLDGLTAHPYYWTYAEIIYLIDRKITVAKIREWLGYGASYNQIRDRADANQAKADKEYVDGIEKAIFGGNHNPLSENVNDPTLKTALAVGEGIVHYGALGAWKLGRWLTGR